MAVLHAHAADPELDITVISKGAVGRSGCTRMVQGGYNAVLDPTRLARPALPGHAQGRRSTSTTRSWRGRWSTTRRRVIHELENRVGCFFDRRADGTHPPEAVRRAVASTAPCTAAT